MNKILILGGTGFIGKNIVQNLMDHNQYVSVYDITKCEFGCESYLGNIKDDNNFNDIVKYYDTIIYLITTVSPKKSMENPTAPYQNDVPLLIKTLDACLKNNVKRVIFASSGGTIYGENNGMKSKETDLNKPINHYAVCKLTCEKILEMYNKLYGMENISLRISNPYGEGQNANSGVGAITAFTDQIKNGKEITLFGDGSVVRDFVYVKDVAEAFYLASKWNFDNHVIPIFNIGSGQGFSLMQIIEMISSTLNIEPRINYLPERDFDVKYNVLDITKAKENLDFSPSTNEKEKIRSYVKKIYLSK